MAAGRSASSWPRVKSTCERVRPEGPRRCSLGVGHRQDPATHIRGPRRGGQRLLGQSAGHKAWRRRRCASVARARAPAWAPVSTYHQS
eukprot:scaffold16237_cov112-Isochrysis_galbana.AAC.5